jgi:hypothetical protein
MARRSPRRNLCSPPSEMMANLRFVGGFKGTVEGASAPPRKAKEPLSGRVAQVRRLPVSNATSGSEQANTYVGVGLHNTAASQSRSDWRQRVLVNVGVQVCRYQVDNTRQSLWWSPRYSAFEGSWQGFEIVRSTLPKEAAPGLPKLVVENILILPLTLTCNACICFRDYSEIGS